MAKVFAADGSLDIEGSVVLTNPKPREECILLTPGVLAGLHVTLPDLIPTYVAHRYEALFKEEYESIHSANNQICKKSAAAKELYDSIYKEQLPYTSDLSTQSVFRTIKNGILHLVSVKCTHHVNHSILSIAEILELDYLRVTIVILSAVVPLLVINLSDSLSTKSTFYEGCKVIDVSNIGSVSESAFSSYGTKCIESTLPIYIGSNKPSKPLTDIPCLNDSSGNCKEITTIYSTTLFTGYSILQFLVYLLTFIYGLILMRKEKLEKVLISKCISLKGIYYSKIQLFNRYHPINSIVFDMLMITSLTTFYALTALLSTNWNSIFYVLPISPNYDDQIVTDFLSLESCNMKTHACTGPSTSFFSSTIYKVFKSSGLDVDSAYRLTYHVNLVSSPAVYALLIIFFFVRLVNLFASQLSLYSWVNPDIFLSNRYDKSSAYYNLSDYRFRSISENIANDISLVNIDCKFWSTILENKDGSYDLTTLLKDGGKSVKEALQNVSTSHGNICSQIENLKSMMDKED